MKLSEKAEKVGNLYQEIGKKKMEIKLLNQQIQEIGFHQEAKEISDWYKKNN